MVPVMNDQPKMMGEHPRSPQSFSVALILTGIILAVLAITADWLAIGGAPGFGWKQGLILLAGILAIRLGWWLPRSARGRAWLDVLLHRVSSLRGRSRGWQEYRFVVKDRLYAFSHRVIALREGLSRRAELGPAEPHPWPTIRDAVLAGVLALLVTAVDIHFSRQLGLLAYPPYYDGIYYMLEAKSTFYGLSVLGLDLPSLTHRLAENRFPFYQALMMLSFLLLGEGEWQAYTVRFWPTFLLLLLMLWLIRRRAGTCLALVAALFTALLPTISVGLRSSGWEYLTGRVIFGWEWYLADLRPDLLFAVLLLWSVVPLIEHVKNPNRRTWLVSGGCAGLAVLTKASASPVLLLAWGLAIAYVLISNRQYLLVVLLKSLWGFASLAVLLTPWALAGGARYTVDFLYQLLTVHRSTYSNPQATFVSEAIYYWNLFSFHMGHVEGWVLLGAGLLLSLATLWKKWGGRDNRLFAFLGISAALYTLASATPTKNYFIGLPYFLLLWLFSWAAVVPFLKRLAQRSRVMIGVLVLVFSLYAATVVGGGFYALQQWPAEERLGGPENRKATQQLAADLGAVLTTDDCFMWIPAYGYPATLQYYMMDAKGQYARGAGFQPVTAPPPDEFIRETAIHCNAILVYAEDIEKVSRFRFSLISAAERPYLRAIADWVRRPDSSYSLLRTYRLLDWVSPVGPGLTVELYVKQSERRASEGH